MLLLCAVFMIGAYWFMNQAEKQEKAYTYREFQEDLQDNNIKKVEVKPDKVAPNGTLRIEKNNGVLEELYVTDVNEAQELLSSYDEVICYVDSVPQESWFATTMLPTLLMIGALVLLVMMMNRQGGANAKAMNFGKSRAKMSTEAENKVKFNQVAGLKEEKEELEEIVDFLKAPGKYIQVGARIPKGVLLEGPPGTGKTLLARAVAGEAGVPFFTISGSDFVEMFVGVGASRVRDLFEDAKHNSPCIVFIDEIDAVARRRGTGMGGGHDEREQTLNQLLVEMDGFGPNEGIIVMAATNRVDILDPAILARACLSFRCIGCDSLSPVSSNGRACC